MLFNKSLVSFIAAIALAGTSTASTTPVRRTGHPTIPAQDCDVNNLTCCDSTYYFGEVSGVIQGLLLEFVPTLDTNLLVGLGCTLTGTVACGTQQATCCEGVVNQHGLVNVAVNCVDIAV